MIKASSNFSLATFSTTARVLQFAVLATAVSALLVGCGGSEQDVAPAVTDSAVGEVVEKAIEPLIDDEARADSGSSASPTLEFIEGAPFPEDFPKDLPFPEGAELVGAFDNPDSDAVSMAVKGAPKELVVTMESDYVDQGWEVTGAETNGRGEGMILATKDGRSVMTLIQPDDKGNSVIKSIAIEGVMK
jgi:hypothetical protein